MTTFTLPVRVYYEDTDGAGHVYHANYLKFAERARIEHFRTSGWQPSNLDSVFAVVAMNIEFKGSALMDDSLTVSSSIVRVGNSSLDVAQTIKRADELLCELKVTLVCINSSKKPVPVPAAIKALA